MRNNSGLAEKGICGSHGAVGRKLRYPEKRIAAFGAGTLARIEAVSAEGEDRTDFIRAAVEKELERRERLKR